MRFVCVCVCVGGGGGGKAASQTLLGYFVFFVTGLNIYLFPSPS